MKTKITNQINFQKIALLLVISLTIIACGKDDNPDKNPIADTNYPKTYFDIPGAGFSDEKLPVSNSSTLMVEEVQGNGIVLAGGSNSLAITASGAPSTLIIGVQDVQGFYFATFDDLGGKGVNIESVMASIQLLIGQEAASNFTLAIAVGDGEGNFSEYSYLPVNLMEAGTGLLQISMSWNQPNDVDLHLIEPNGEEIYYGSSISGNGGQLDVDSNAACSLDNINNENIFYEDNSSVTIEEGEYEVLINLWSNCSVDGNTDYIVTVYYDGALIATTQGINPYNGSFSPDDDMNDPTSVLKFNISGTAPKGVAGTESSQSIKAYKFNFKSSDHGGVLSPEKM